MNTLEAIYADGATLKMDVPESWDELSKKQFAALAPLVYSTNVVSMMARFIYTVLGKKLFKQISGDENIDELSHGFAWLTVFPVLKKSHYKGFVLFGRRWMGIEDRLMDMNIEEFSVCEQCLSYLEAPENQKAFYGTIYKRGIFEFLPIRTAKKYALRLNYEAARGNLSVMYPALPVSKSTKEPDYHALILNISGKKFGNYNETKRALLHDVLKDLELNAIEAAKQPQTTQTLEV